MCCKLRCTAKNIKNNIFSHVYHIKLEVKIQQSLFLRHQWSFSHSSWHDFDQLICSPLVIDLNLVTSDLCFALHNVCHYIFFHSSWHDFEQLVFSPFVIDLDFVMSDLLRKIAWIFTSSDKYECLIGPCLVVTTKAILTHKFLIMNYQKRKTQTTNLVQIDWVNRTAELLLPLFCSFEDECFDKSQDLKLRQLTQEVKKTELGMRLLCSAKVLRDKDFKCFLLKQKRTFWHMVCFLTNPFKLHAIIQRRYFLHMGHLLWWWFVLVSQGFKNWFLRCTKFRMPHSGTGHTCVAYRVPGRS